jgi:hypothetical protein
MNCLELPGVARISRALLGSWGQLLIVIAIVIDSLEVAQSC